jgi:hypothetical protein
MGHRCRLLAVILTALLLSGCEKRPELGLVTGTLTLDGKPLDGVLVKFMPDPETGNAGATSFSLTDDLGKFDLVFGKDQDTHGAITGWHRVIVEDPAREDRPPGPQRVPPKFSSAAKTPLKYEVLPETQSFTIELKRG